MIDNIFHFEILQISWQIILVFKNFEFTTFFNDKFIFQKIHNYQIKLHFDFVYNKIKIIKNVIVN